MIEAMKARGNWWVLCIGTDQSGIDDYFEEYLVWNEQRWSTAIARGSYQDFDIIEYL